MVSRVKMAMVAVFAAAAVSAVAAGSASAGWLVNGTPLGAGHSAEIAKLATVHGSVLLIADITPPVGVLCKGPIHIINGRILEPDLAYADHIVFLDCNVSASSPSTCKLSPALTTLETNAVLALVTLGPTALSGRITFKPETGKIFTEVPFENETTCVFEGKVPVKGSVTVGAPTLRDSRAAQAGEGLGGVENNSLEIGANKALLHGGLVLLQLGSGANWSFD